MAYVDHNADNDRTDRTVATAPSRTVKAGASQAATAFVVSRTDWQQAAARRLSQVIRLGKGWDGHQGYPVNPTIADYAYQLLEDLLLRPGVPLPSITPLSYGGLVLEWHRRGWDVEIEIEAPASHCVYTHELATGVEESFPLGRRLDRLRDIIGKIVD